VCVLTLAFGHISQTTDFPDEGTTPRNGASGAAAAEIDVDPALIKKEAEKWVSRCQTAAYVVVVAWIGWIVAAQLLRQQNILPPVFFMSTSDDSAITGW
jgi:hypothetical protein